MTDVSLEIIDKMAKWEKTHLWKDAKKHGKKHYL